MAIITKRITLETAGGIDLKDITRDLRRTVDESGLKEGSATVFVPGSTAAVTTIEYEPGLVADIKRALEQIAPAAIPYEHDQRWHDGNGHSHIRAALLKPSLTIPFADGSLLLGTWQQVVFIELDVRPRTRMVVVQLIGT
ncbi:MAG: secondary thiamine-phosphate synthase enzyme YjbQ [Halobacteriota archaeon]